jgi:rubrerythrin
MDGGINSYHGLVATGGPEAGMAWFPEGADTPQLTALAWLLEDGTEKFYAQACKHICREDAHRQLVSMLEAAEDAHKRRLMETCSALMGREPRDDFPEGLIEMPDEDYMEGGVKVSEALEWAEGKEIREVIDLMMALEANAFDLYIRMSRRVDDKSSEVFTSLAEEERTHLNRLAQALTALG